MDSTWQSTLSLCSRMQRPLEHVEGLRSYPTRDSVCKDCPVEAPETGMPCTLPDPFELCPYPHASPPEPAGANPPKDGRAVPCKDG